MEVLPFIMYSLLKLKTKSITFIFIEAYKNDKRIIYKTNGGLFI